MRLIAAMVTLVLCAVAQAQPALLERGPEMERLEYFLGAWEGELTRRVPRGEPLELAPSVRFDWDVGGAWLRGEDRTRLADGSLIVNMTWMTWHKGKGVYSGAWQDNVFPEMVPFEGRWVDEATLVLETGTLEIGGRAHSVSLTYTIEDRDTYRVAMRQSWDEREARLVSEGVFRRAKAD